MNNSSKLPGVSTLLGTTFSFYRQHAKAIIILSLLPLAFEIILTILPMIFPVQKSFGILVTSIVISGIIGFASSLIQFMYPVALTKVVDSTDSGLVLPTKNAYKAAFKIFFSWVAICILTAAVLFTGLFLLVIPAISLLVYTLLAGYYVVLDRKTGINSLVASYFSIKGDWWAVFGRAVSVLLVWFIPIVLLCLVYAAGILLSGKGFSEALRLLSTGQISTFLQFVFSLLSLIGIFVSTSILVPITGIYFYQIYKHLKTSKPEATEEQIKKKRTFFIWFASVGVVLWCAVVFGNIIFGAYIGYQKAKHNVSAISTHSSKAVSSAISQAVENQNTEGLATVDGLFPNTTTDFPVGDISVLESKVRKNQNLGFQVQIPKGWQLYSDADGAIINPSGMKPEASVSISKIDLPITALKLSQAQVAEEVAEQALEYAKKLKNTEFATYNLNDEALYSVSGTYSDSIGHASRQSYYILIDNLEAFVLNLRSSQKDFDLAESLLLPSISTFRVIK